jgi:hypothetical protein
MDIMVLEDPGIPGIKDHDVLHDVLRYLTYVTTTSSPLPYVCPLYTTTIPLPLLCIYILSLLRGDHGVHHGWKGVRGAPEIPIPATIYLEILREDLRSILWIMGNVEPTNPYDVLHDVLLRYHVHYVTT